MVDTTIHHELTAALGQLPVALQHQVLEYARSLATAPPQGVSGSNLLRFAGSIDESDLNSMSQTIEEGCEGIDSDGW